MSDGCLKREGRNKTTYAVRICSNDFDVIRWIHEYACVGNKIYRQGVNGYQIKYRNQEAISFMMQNNLQERKSLIMQFPHIPEQYTWDFIKGYFDGDGSVILRNTNYNTYGQISFTSGSLYFLEGLQKFLAHDNIDAKIYKDGRATNNSYYLRIIKRSEIEKMYYRLYQTSQSQIKLTRKYEKYTHLIDCKPKYNI